MEIKDRVLIIEDDKSIRNFLRAILEANHYDVLMANSGVEAYSMITSQCPDVVILDLGLPDMDGMEILKNVREWSSMPILVVSARSHEKDKVQALDLGADDYITKPFGVMELISRVRALIRRSMDSGASKSLRVGSIFLDSDRHMVYVDDEPKELTFKEYELLRCLMSNSGVAMHRDRIMELVWGTDFEGESRTLDMHIKTLRQKLGTAGSMIKTVRNVGYVLEE